MKTLIIVGGQTAAASPSLAELFSAAEKISSGYDILLIGDVISELAVSESVGAVYLAQNSSGNLSASTLAKGISSFCKGYTHILMAANSFGKDLLPRIAGILDVTQFSEVTEILSPQVFKRPIYAGNALAYVESLEAVNLLTIRTQAFIPYAGGMKNATVKIVDLGIVVDSRVEITGRSQSIVGDIPPLAQAKVIVSGGRSLGSKENFNHLIHQLAVKFGGAMGATRAAVEAGYATNDIQVGQTGQIVAPALYIAVGVSGAVQHIAGMKDSKIVVAINSDENAQIFEYADYGLVGDLFEVVPQLLEKL